LKSIYLSNFFISWSY